MSDDAKVAIACMVILAAISLTGVSAVAYVEISVKSEAIRAGLVQDKDGHWIKPEAKEPTP